MAEACLESERIIIMNPFFSILSAAYIAGIFLFADSPVVSEAATFNPYSLLHIPLYGILTLLLNLSFYPRMGKFNNSKNSINPRNSTSYFIAGIIAFVVAVTDEIHQAYLPTRNASIVDVILDVVGVSISIFLSMRFQKRPWVSKKMEYLSRLASYRASDSTGPKKRNTECSKVQ